jgi:4'-phosphopantetheinyl transferase
MLNLGDDEVHAWLLPLARGETEMAALLEVLSPRQRARAARFRFDRDRHRYVASEGLMRTIVGRYVGVPPGELNFAYGPRGKPSVPDAPWLCFNLSRSHEQALLGVTRQREIGVDIERVRDLPDYELIAQHFFAAGERSALLRLPESGRRQAFFNCWTRKEAYVKAIGDGLYSALDSFEVSLGEPVRLISVGGDPAGAARWRVVAEPAPAGYATALVVEGWDWRLSSWSAA